MASVWQDPKTDWDSEQQGVGNADFNRIEGNIEFLGGSSGIVDADGNAYQTVTINGQQWTTRNWRSTKYADGTAIPEVTDQTAWDALTTPAYCTYEGFNTKYGLLYNHFVVEIANPEALAPEGWRVATSTDLFDLFTFLSESGYSNAAVFGAADVAKAMAQRMLWSSATSGAVGDASYENNVTGFSFNPAGIRSTGFTGQADMGAIWASDGALITAPYYMRLDHDSNTPAFGLDFPATHGLGVRMVKDV